MSNTPATLRFLQHGLLKLLPAGTHFIAGKVWVFEGQIVDLQRGEDAPAACQVIHPERVVSALVDVEQLIIESVNIIQHLARHVHHHGWKVFCATFLQELPQRKRTGSNSLLDFCFEVPVEISRLYLRCL